MKTDNFNFFVPLEFEKADAAPGDAKRYKNMILRGVASTSDVDADNEVLEPSGFDLSIFRTKGFVNYEHLSKQNPLNNIGEPIEADIVNNQLVIKAKLWETSPMAKNLWDTLHIMKESGSTRKLGWSIEGKPLQRDPRNPKRITKAMITNVAATFMPKNANTFAEVCKGHMGSKEEFDYDIPENVDFLFKGVYGDNEYTLHKDFTITKSMCAGTETGQALVGKDTSGAALKMESLDPDLKILTIPIATIKYTGDTWKDFTEDTKKAIQKGLHSILEKAGEGSRGGKIIGHTKSGKPIYANKEYHQYSDFSEQDHRDAAAAHKQAKEERGKGKKSIGKTVTGEDMYRDDKWSKHHFHHNTHEMQADTLKHAGNKEAIKKVYASGKVPMGQKVYANHRGYHTHIQGDVHEFTPEGKFRETVPGSFYFSGNAHTKMHKEVQKEK